MYTSDFDYESKKGFKIGELKIMYYEICREMEQIGYDEIEYQQSEEVFTEVCEANGYTFREDGTMEDE